jgi:hypothetical protein
MLPSCSIRASQNQQTASTVTGMNPQHGQAGHRCDIAVGAPLNSPVAAAANSTATPQNIQPQVTLRLLIL